MKTLLKNLSVNNFAEFCYKNSPSVALDSLESAPNWAKEQLKKETADSLGNLMEMDVLSIDNIIGLLSAESANKNWNNKDGNPANSARYVLALQAGLKIIGYENKVNSIFGSGTRSVVEKFQSDYGLTVDGGPGPQTIGKMLYVLKDKKEPEEREIEETLEIDVMEVNNTLVTSNSRVINNVSLDKVEYVNAEDQIDKPDFSSEFVKYKFMKILGVDELNLVEDKKYVKKIFNIMNRIKNTNHRDRVMEDMNIYITPGKFSDGVKKWRAKDAYLKRVKMMLSLSNS